MRNNVITEIFKEQEQSLLPSKQLEVKLLKLTETQSNKVVFFVNGFLQENKENQFDDWVNMPEFEGFNKVGVKWNSASWSEIRKFILPEFKKKKLTERLKDTLKGAINNPWHTTMIHAKKVGEELANLLSRLNGGDFEIYFAGHSLGAKVIFHTLLSLSNDLDLNIKNVYLLGGATDRSNKKEWNIVSMRIKGDLYNYYSQNDKVLSRLYKVANIGLISPIGEKPIEGRFHNIHNVNCEDWVDSHFKWKRKRL